MLSDHWFMLCLERTRVVQSECAPALQVLHELCSALNMFLFINFAIESVWLFHFLLLQNFSCEVFSYLGQDFLMQLLVFDNLCNPTANRSSDCTGFKF